MKLLLEIAVGLVTALIGFTIGWLWKELRKRVRYRRARRFWKPFIEERLQVVVGRHEEFLRFEPSGFLGMGCAIGLSELAAYFEAIGFSRFEVSYADRLDGDSLKSNLILIGGPDANAITKEAAAKVRTTIKFGNPKIHEIALFDSLSDRTYVPERGKTASEVIRDYGVIIKSRNPFAPNTMILILAGSFGFGTWAAVRHTTSEEFLRNEIVAKATAIECLIETDVVFDTPQAIRSLLVRDLNI